MSAGRGAFLDDALIQFRKYKAMAERAMAQIDDAQFFAAPGPEENSVALIVKHVAGNQRSRWTDFLTSDGEKPDRNRDMEFVIEASTTKQDVLDYWERGWACVFAAIEPLKLEDFEKKVTIRGEPHTIVMAINRQLMHYSYHIGQIVFLAKHFRSAQWNSLSIPRNKSAEFNAKMQSQTK